MYLESYILRYALQNADTSHSLDYLEQLQIIIPAFQNHTIARYYPPYPSKMEFHLNSPYPLLLHANKSVLNAKLLSKDRRPLGICT